MRVFVAGATGAIGDRLVPMLVHTGHKVFGMTRSANKAERVRALGATPVVADARDRNSVIQAVREAAPEAIAHELTAIPDNLNLRKWERQFALTNRLRTEGLDNLIAAASSVDCRRFVAQSFAGWPYAREGGPIKPRTTRWTPIRLALFAPHSTPFATWNRLSPGSAKWSASLCDMARCTALATRSALADSFWRKFANVTCRSSAAEPADSASGAVWWQIPGTSRSRIVIHDVIDTGRARLDSPDGVPVVGFTWYSLQDQVDWPARRLIRSSCVAVPADLFAMGNQR